MAEELKVAANALFGSKDYDGAAAKYSEAIAMDPRSAVLYSNRAACYHALARQVKSIGEILRILKIPGRHEDGLLDASKVLFYRTNESLLNIQCAGNRDRSRVFKGMVSQSPL